MAFPDYDLAVQAMRLCDSAPTRRVGRSDGSYLEDQDHWWLSGIHRDVWLYRKPSVHLADIDARIALTPKPFGGGAPAHAAQSEAPDEGGNQRGSSARVISHHAAQSEAPSRALDAAQSEAPQQAAATHPPSYSASLQVRGYVMRALMSTDEH